MLKKIIRVFLLLFITFTAILGALGVDRYLSRDDRIRLAKEKVRLEKLSDAILRFKINRERLPKDLSELVPGYVREDMTTFQPDARTDVRERFLWDAETRILAWGAPLRIRGLIPRTENFELEVADLPVIRDPLRGEKVFKQTSEQTGLGEKEIVVEAELFQFMTYGWEIEERKDASGIRYIHMKEGVGDSACEEWIRQNPAVRSGDFYNITGDRRRIEARCYFMTPREGDYFTAVRTMAHRSHCSSRIFMKVNDGECLRVGRHRTIPLVWLWHKVGKIHLKKGLNSVSFMALHDDVKVDQVVFSPKPLHLMKETSGTFFAGYQEEPALPDGIPPVTLSLSVDTLAVTAEKDPEVLIYVRKNVPGDIGGTLRTCLDITEDRKRERSHDIKLTGSQELTKFQYEFDLPRPLEKKEYLLRCQLLVGSRVVQERTVVFFHGYDWSILGPLPFLGFARGYGPETDLPPGNSYSFRGKTFSWRKYSEAYTDHFGIMDFGMMFCGRSFHAVTQASLYAYTEIEAKDSGFYRLKAMGDDSIVIWINGEVAAAIFANGPPIRSAREFMVQLRAGRNRILFRLNQRAAQWQGAIRIRTPDDKIADVTGIPFEQQDIEFY